MTDVVIVALITGSATILSVVITGVLNYWQNRKIVEKVDGYHKEVNGKMGELLVTTKALGNAEGVQEQKDKENDK